MTSCLKNPTAGYLLMASYKYHRMLILAIQALLLPTEVSSSVTYHMMLQLDG